MSAGPQIEITQKDALDFLEGVPDETVDVLITDPPYWTLDKWRNVGTTTRMGGHRDKDKQRDEMFFETIDQQYLWDFFLECDRVLKLDGHLYIFCDHNVLPILCNWVREAQGEHRFGECHPIVWDKINMGMGYHYRGQYENILFAWRVPRGPRIDCLSNPHDGVRGFKARQLANLGISDVLKCKRVTKGYPTEKPEEIVRTLVRQSARPGDTICDPFAGSGVVGAVVPQDWVNCRVLLNDKSPASIKHIYARLNAPKPQTLFGEGHAQNDLEARG